MTATDTERTVPNPAYLDLERLRARIAQVAPQLGEAFDGPARDLGGGKVWTGPAAEAFAAEVSGRQRRLGTLVHDLLAAVDARMRATPRLCSSQEAQSYLHLRRSEKY